MSLSIIIPVFNEVKLLPQILRKVIQATPLIDKEIIIVDDCSNDGTEKWLTAIRKKKYNYISFKKNKLFFKKNKTLMNLRIILKNKNEGKGSAVIIGLKHSKKNIIESLIKNVNKFNVLITTGGASVGYEDYLIDIIKEKGKIFFWQTAIKPGRPLAIGKIEKTIINHLF